MKDVGTRPGAANWRVRCRSGTCARESGAAIKDPDRQVQARLSYVFRLFARYKVARQVLLQLNRENLQVPAKIWGGPRHGQVTWKKPDLSDVIRLLHNPTYAGAYVYGQMEYDSFDRYPTNGKAKVHPRRAGGLAGLLARCLPGLYLVGAVREESGDAPHQWLWL